jgi:hypothetical protein
MTIEVWITGRLAPSVVNCGELDEVRHAERGGEAEDAADDEADASGRCPLFGRRPGSSDHLDGRSLFPSPRESEALLRWRREGPLPLE